MVDVQVDDEVFRALQELAEPLVDTPNSVLRRLLKLAQSDRDGALGALRPASRPPVVAAARTEAAHVPRPPAAGARRGVGIRTRTNRDGDLQDLIDQGVLVPGDVLEWPRNSSTHLAVLTQDGELQLEDGTTWRSPSGAARHLAGYEVNGWIQWRSEDGTLLDAYRR